MNLTFELVGTWLVVIIVFVINNGKLIKTIFSKSKDLVGLVDSAKLEMKEDVNKISLRADKTMSITTFLIKEKVADLQARLEITNDPEEQKELLNKIKTYTELLQ